MFVIGPPYKRGLSFSLNPIINIMRHYTHTYEEFIKRAHQIHGDIYDYSLSKEEFQFYNLINRTPPYITIICKTCGNIFRQSKASHVGAESGCPNCLASSREKLIRDYLDNNGIIFIQHPHFYTLKWKAYLRPDFYLPGYNLIIEINGTQHYLPWNIKGQSKNNGLDALRDTRIRDYKKQVYFRKNKYHLIKFSHKDSVLFIKDYLSKLLRIMKCRRVRRHLSYSNLKPLIPSYKRFRKVNKFYTRREPDSNRRRNNLNRVLKRKFKNVLTL